jgi:hypothetical protein
MGPVREPAERAQAAWAVWQAAGERDSVTQGDAVTDRDRQGETARALYGAAEEKGSGGTGGQGDEGQPGTREKQNRGRGPDKQPRKPGTGRWQQRHLDHLPALKARVERIAANPAVLPTVRHPKKRLFALALAECGNRRQAAAVAGVDRTTPYSPPWREDRVLQVALEQALEMAADRLEAEAFRRAVEGVERRVGWYRGKAGGVTREYSDVLAIFLLKGLRPHRYKDRVEMRGALANLDLNQLPDVAIERIARGEHVLSVLASMVPRAGEAVPGLLRSSEERE